MEPEGDGQEPDEDPLTPPPPVGVKNHDFVIAVRVGAQRERGAERGGYDLELWMCIAGTRHI